ncbi:hypothetical protein TWF694_010555 [Orbilia ellipsospora]|uniref:Exosome complex protein n=1 Tax=Orbilia ellipsospora TaxID=2528407 RepID=A0AAV9XBE0_9PEZI
MESELWPALDDFEDATDLIEKNLKPLLDQSLPKHASMLPLFDKAKLYIMTTYALESLLFSYLSTSSVDITNHPIMKELTRVRQYFQKIRDIESKDSEKAKSETTTTEPTSQSQHLDTRDNLVLDKAAASRFISAALQGNDKYDIERAENIRLQKERAKEKFEELGAGVKDAIGRRAADSDSDDEEGGVRLVTGESDDEGAKLEGTPTAETEGKADEKSRRKKDKKRKRELEAKDAGEGKKKSKKDKAKKEKKEKAKKK